MSEKNIKKKIQRLRKEIKYHDELYYRKNTPEIFDSDYDWLKKELIALEEQYPHLLSSESPSQTVGDDRIQGFETHRHLQPMLSLDNTYNKEELFEFEKHLLKTLQPQSLEYTIEPKIDGIAVSLTYKNGKFAHAVTRGNGIQGDIITHNLKTLHTLPQTLSPTQFPKIIELRGEIYITHQEFERINQERKQTNKPIYANPRNLAAGTVKQIHTNADRKLEILLHGLGHCEPEIFTRQTQFQTNLKSLNFPVIEKTWQAKSI